MSVYEKELMVINRIQGNTARFFRVAFHCHSPLSVDWGKKPGVDVTLNDKQKYLVLGGEEKYCRLVKQYADCHMMVISDHMKCWYAERAVQFSKVMPELIVLPGMEITLLTTPALGGVKLHVIIILPPELTRETFARLLPGVPEEDNRVGKN